MFVLLTPAAGGMKCCSFEEKSYLGAIHQYLLPSNNYLLHKLWLYHNYTSLLLHCVYCASTQMCKV